MFDNNKKMIEQFMNMHNRQVQGCLVYSTEGKVRWFFVSVWLAVAIHLFYHSSWQRYAFQLILPTELLTMMRALL